MEKACSATTITTIKTLALGQVLSILLCCTATSSTGLSVWFNISVPCFQSFLNYVLLAITAGAAFVSSDQFVPTLRQHWWKYLILGTLDFEANYLIIKAYSYTTLTSVQLCDSFAIPSVVLLSLVFLRMRFRAIHYVGVALCMLGSVCLVLTDKRSTQGNAPDPVMGDLLALAGAFLYGVSNTAQEHLVKNHSILEYLGMMSLFATVVSGIQTIVIERNAVITASSSWEISGLLLLFTLSQYFFYLGTPFIMSRSIAGATLFNLSLLTADFFTLLIGLKLFNYKFSNYYFLAFAAVVFGLGVYNLKPIPVVTCPVSSPPKTMEHESEGVPENLIEAV